MYEILITVWKSKAGKNDLSNFFVRNLLLDISTLRVGPELLASKARTDPPAGGKRKPPRSNSLLLEFAVAHYPT